MNVILGFLQAGCGSVSDKSVHRLALLIPSYEVTKRNLLYTAPIVSPTPSMPSIYISELC